MSQRCLIVNADDFGQGAAVNRGVMQAHEHGIVTSASLMVRWPAAADAADIARKCSTLGVGLHIDLGEWTFRDGNWVPLYEVVATNDDRAVHSEVHRQLEAFRRLMGRDPTHLDTHQHVHRREPARRVVVTLGNQLHIPVRHFTPGIRYCGDFYGQTERGEPVPAAISAQALLALISDLPAGVTEVACHPAIGLVHGTMYSSERQQEVQALCDPRVRLEVQAAGVALVNFRALAAGASV